MTMESEQFDYSKAMEELEAIASKIEDPATGIQEVGKYIKRSDELIARCRDYLRSVRESLENKEG